jgi:hypothetical protein
MQFPFSELAPMQKNKSSTISATELGQLELVDDSFGFDIEGAGFKRTSDKFVGYGIEKWRLDG